MPCIIAQEASPTRLSVTSALATTTDAQGHVVPVTWTLTKAEIQAYYRDHTSGNAAQRKAQVIAWVKTEMISVCWPGLVLPEHIVVDADLSDDSTPLWLEL